MPRPTAQVSNVNMGQIMFVFTRIIDIAEAIYMRILECCFDDEPEEDLMIEADRPPRIIEDDEDDVVAIAFRDESKDSEKSEKDDD